VGETLIACLSFVLIVSSSSVWCVGDDAEEGSRPDMPAVEGARASVMTDEPEHSDRERTVSPIGLHDDLLVGASYIRVQVHYLPSNDGLWDLPDVDDHSQDGTSPPSSPPRGFTS
jgi:hypothetical protein